MLSLLLKDLNFFLLLFNESRDNSKMTELAYICKSFFMNYDSESVGISLQY